MTNQEDEPIRGKFKYEGGKLVRIAEAKKLHIAPYVQTDEVHEGIHSHANDKIYTSKSAYRQSLKTLGYRETGGDHLADKPRPKTDEQLEREIRDDTERAINLVKNNDFPFSEKEKQMHIEEERACQTELKRLKTKWA